MQMRDPIKVEGQKTMTELPDKEHHTPEEKQYGVEGNRVTHASSERQSESELGSRQRACLMKSYRRSHTERASVIRLPCLRGKTSRDSLKRRRVYRNLALLLCFFTSFGDCRAEPDTDTVLTFGAKSASGRLTN